MTPSPRLAALKAYLDALLDDAFIAESFADPAPARSALAAFRACGPQLLDEATEPLWSYYRDTAEEFSEEQCRRYGMPLLAPGADIWAEVTITSAPTVRPGTGPLAPAAAYVSFEGEVSWEPEHGLQLVIVDGVRVGKVSPYDDHLTNAHAHGDASLLGVVYHPS